MRGRVAMRAVVALLSGAAMMLAGLPASAADVTIADIVAHPDAYDGVSVTVVGTVERALPVGTQSGYELRDGRFKMSVISRASAPRLGDHLLVTGTVRHFKEGDEPEANEYPPVLVESARQPAP
jgi:hypothetical protein